MLKHKRKILAIDLILVIGSLLIVAGMVGYSSPLVIAPLDDFETTNTGVLFEFEKANVIFIDDNPEFSSPQEIHVEDSLVVNLEPGVYYWKVGGVLSSYVRKLTIESDISLKLKESEDGERYEIVNSGNTDLNVDIYQDEELKSTVILGVDEEEEVSGTKFIGSQGGEDND